MTRILFALLGYGELQQLAVEIRKKKEINRSADYRMPFFTHKYPEAAEIDFGYFFL